MSQLQTVSKALDLLTILGKGDQYLSVEELSKELDVPESTTYRLIQTLEAKGFVERYSRKKISLGSNFLSLARAFENRLDKELCLIARQYMIDVTEQCKETCILSIRVDTYSKCIRSISSKYVIRFVADDNRLVPLHIGASSRAILAFENDQIINNIIGSLPTQAEQIALRKEIEQVKQCGYAISCNEIDASCVGIGVPIYNTFGHIYASLAIVGPDSRLKREHWIDYAYMLMNASSEITKHLSDI